MHLPQILMLSLFGIALLLEARDHGKPKTGKDNFFLSATAISLQLALLAWGGFFK